MSRPARRRSAPSEGPTGEEAVAEVMGNLLMVVASVVLASVATMMLLALPQPLDALHADLTLSLEDPDGTWNTGDELVVLRHIGGERIHEDETEIVVLVAGVSQTYEGEGLGAAFDPDLIIGEEWNATRTIASGAEVEVALVHRSGGSSHIAFGGKAVAGG